ncbi:hypothetical protein M413DRAFT_30980 [Hebeloma cylindrosporum]|uniref:Uncharacterized protein n=1 Tax=Hebeloma cylindrosporum TaxID=76867 RepID=A0A0C3BKK9_HEBCY|nr:hypothetical protein M413DRAFT_30980 [Hebeloma cylindrosporum h7]
MSDLPVFISAPYHLLGPCELMKSHNPAVVESSGVRGLCEVVKFRDTEYIVEKPVSSQTWYYRFKLHYDGTMKGLNDHCLCRQEYEPEKVIQRYWPSCSMWFDVGCLREHVLPPIASDIPPDNVVGKILTMPILRGKLGPSANSWRISGSGAMVHKAMWWNKAHRPPRDWKEQLGASFIQYAQNNTLTHFRCPQDSCPMII